jgi:hypothetical protein
MTELPPARSSQLPCPSPGHNPGSGRPLFAEGWTITNDVVLFQGRIFLPATSIHWATVLEQAHGTGHEGVQKTLQRLRASFYTPQDNRLVREFIKGCATCQRFKMEHLHLAGLLQPLVMPSSVWSDTAMDFIEGFPCMGGGGGDP